MKHDKGKIVTHFWQPDVQLEVYCWKRWNPCILHRLAYRLGSGSLNSSLLYLPWLTRLTLPRGSFFWSGTRCPNICANFLPRAEILLAAVIYRFGLIAQPIPPDFLNPWCDCSRNFFLVEVKVLFRNSSEMLSPRLFIDFKIYGKSPKSSNVVKYSMRFSPRVRRHATNWFLCSFSVHPSTTGLFRSNIRWIFSGISQSLNLACALKMCS